MEHHSNIVPWQLLCEERGARLRVAPMNDRGELMLDELEALVGERTKLVSVTHMSNALGTINPVEDIIRIAHRRGVPVLLDGSQAAYHMPVDVQALDCDFYAATGHKLYGPTGMGILYGKEAHLESMPPFLGGGDMISSVTFEKSTWNALPHKFEAGTPDISGAIALGVAIDYIQSIGFSWIAEHEQALLEYGTEALTAHRRPSPDWHGAAEGEHPVVRARRRASARHRHDRGSRGRRRPHRSSLRAAGHGPLRRPRDRTRVAGDVQHARGDRRAGAGAGPREGDLSLKDWRSVRL